MTSRELSGEFNSKHRIGPNMLRYPDPWEVLTHILQSHGKFQNQVMLNRHQRASVSKNQTHHRSVLVLGSSRESDLSFFISMWTLRNEELSHVSPWSEPTIELLLVESCSRAQRSVHRSQPWLYMFGTLQSVCLSTQSTSSCPISRSIVVSSG